MFSLSQKDIDTITAWATDGALKGNDKDMPPMPKFPVGWNIGKPDAIFEMTEEFNVPAKGVVPYMYFTIPTHLTEDIGAYDLYLKQLEIGWRLGTGREPAAQRNFQRSTLNSQRSSDSLQS